jgi:dTDP-glucose 4,6-dehydratase
MSRVLVTGGAGFIGSALVRHLLDETSSGVTVLDALTYAANPTNLDGLDAAHGARFRFLRGDVCAPDDVARALEGVEAVIHLAAETHVDRSIADDAVVLRTNVLGTRTVLARARAAGVGRVVHVSTDEVYGTLPRTAVRLDDAGRVDEVEGDFSEDAPLRPRSPYAASKAAGDWLAQAHHTTHGQDVVIVRPCNVYGPRQHPEKLIPLMVLRALAGAPLPVYGDGLQVRDWVHVTDVCRGLLAALRRGRPGRVYNLGAGQVHTNLEVVRAVLERTGADPGLIRHVPDRPGHDFGYALDVDRARRELGWTASVPFARGLPDTVAWYRTSAAWRRHASPVPRPPWMEPGSGGAPEGATRRGDG